MTAGGGEGFGGRGPTSTTEAAWAIDGTLFAQWLAGSKFKPRTEQTYLERVGEFVKWLTGCEDLHPGALTSAGGRDSAVAAYRAHLQQRSRPSTVNVSLAAVNAYYTYRGLGPSAVPAVKVSRLDRSALTAQERSRVLDAAASRPARDRALFVLALGAGLRESELARLQDCDVVLEGAGSVTVGGRTIPLQPAVRVVLLKWWAERGRILGDRSRNAFFLSRRTLNYLTPRRVDSIIRSIGEAAVPPILGLSPGVLRNTFHLDLILSGLDDAQVRYLMGQSVRDVAGERALLAAAHRRGSTQRTASEMTLNEPRQLAFDL